MRLASRPLSAASRRSAVRNAAKSNGPRSLPPRPIFVRKFRVGNHPSQSLLQRETVRTMKLLTSAGENSVSSRELETLMLSDRHLDYLERISQSINPEMPTAFGWPQAIRAILDRIEESGIDLTDTSSEEEIAHLAAGRLRGHERRRRPASGPLSSSRSTSRRASRPTYRANQPETDRCRSGRRPRSGHG